MWQFGSVNGNGWKLQLNAIPVTAGYLGIGGIGGVTPVSLIEVNAHGQLFAQGADGVADGVFYSGLSGLHKKYSLVQFRFRLVLYLLT